MPLADLTEAQRGFILKYLGVGQDDPGQGGDAAAWEAAARDMAKRVEGFTESGSPAAAKIAAAWKQVVALAGRGDHAKALEGSKRVAAAMAQANREEAPGQPQGIGGVSLVKLGVARAEWPTVRLSAQTQIGTLKSKLRAAYAPFPGESAKVEAAIGQIDRVISVLDDSLKTQLDDVYNAQDDDSRIKAVAVVRRTVTQFKTFVESDPVAGAIDGNSFAPEIAPIGPIRKNLDSMMAALGG